MARDYRSFVVDSSVVSCGIIAALFFVASFYVSQYVPYAYTTDSGFVMKNSYVTIGLMVFAE